jgi:hypothetical protein
MQRQRRPDLYDNDPVPCPRCLTFIKRVASERELQTGIQEMIQPLQGMAPALARDGSGPCCSDCPAADTLHRLLNPEADPRGFEDFVAAASTTFCPIPYTEPCDAEESGPNRSTAMTWRMVRVAVGNDRRDQLRCPGLPLGLCMNGLVAVSEKGDLELHWEWLKKNGLWWDHEEEE